MPFLAVALSFTYLMTKIRPLMDRGDQNTYNSRKKYSVFKRYVVIWKLEPLFYGLEVWVCLVHVHTRSNEYACLFNRQHLYLSCIVSEGWNDTWGCIRASEMYMYTLRLRFGIYLHMYPLVAGRPFKCMYLLVKCSLTAHPLRLPAINRNNWSQRFCLVDIFGTFPRRASNSEYIYFELTYFSPGIIRISSLVFTHLLFFASGYEFPSIEELFRKLEIVPDLKKKKWTCFIGLRAYWLIRICYLCSEWLALQFTISYSVVFSLFKTAFSQFSQKSLHRIYLSGR